MRDKKLVFGNESAVIISAALALSVLSLLVAVSPRELVYDERFHIVAAQLLQDGAGIREVLAAPLPSAPGPLYPVLHVLISPLTALKPPAIRLLNLAILVATLCSIAHLLRSLGNGNAIARASMLLALPVTWVTGGLALTEMPALWMATLCCCMLAPAVIREGPKLPAFDIYGRFALAGVFAALAILGRQTYLPILLIFLALSLANSSRLPALLALGLALACILPVFMIWGGLTPRSQAHLGGGIYPTNGALGFAYLGVYIAIIAPAFYRPLPKWFIPSAALLLVVNLAVMKFEFRPFNALFSRLSAESAHLVALGCGAALLASMVLIARSLARQLRSRSGDRVFMATTLLTVILTGTTFGISQFSSRYLLAAFPFALVMAQPFFLPTRGAAIRLLLGASLGGLSVASYYW